MLAKKLCVFLLACLLASGLSAQTPTKSVQISRSEVHVQSPLYDAYIDVEYRMLSRLRCTVTRSDIAKLSEQAERNWWTPKELSQYSLEDADYNNSGYQRGHVRALRWSTGSLAWPDVNMMGVIVPQRPEVNNGAVKGLENHVFELVSKYGSVDVNVSCRFTAFPPVILRTADEPHRIPDAFAYDIFYFDGEAHRSESYLIRNSADVPKDFKATRIP